MSLAIRLKTFNPTQLASIAFYALTGIILLAFLPLTGFPPHLGLIAVVSLITAYSLFAKRAWAPWLVIILFVINTVFSLYTLYSVGLSNTLIALSMIAYAALTWVATAYLILRRKD